MNAKTKTVFVAWIAAAIALAAPAAHAYNVSPGYTFDPETAHCIEYAVKHRNERAICSQDSKTQHDVAIHLNQWFSRVYTHHNKEIITPLQADRIENPERMPRRVIIRRPPY